MKIVPKFQSGGISSVITRPQTTWFTRSGQRILERTYDNLKTLYDKYKSTERFVDYIAFKNKVDELNNDQRTGYASNHNIYETNGNKLFSDGSVGSWQDTIKKKYGYVNDSIGENWNQYNILSKKPTSGDRQGVWSTDSHWAGITNDRTTLGYGGLDDQDYLNWQQKFKDIGIDYGYDNSVNNEYYLKLNESSPNNPPSASVQTTPEPTKEEEGRIIPKDIQDRTNFLDKFRSVLNRVGPDILSATRLAGNLYNNQRVYDAVKAGIRPNLQQSYNTYRQIVGDEATKQAYYNKGADLITRMSRPFTSDSERARAAAMEAYRQANELRAQGDLADNQRIRETSAEAAAHADGNKQRWTEAANYNIMQQNQAKAAKQQLLAQKYASDWTDIDTYLLEKESRWRTDLAENKSIQNQIKLLQAEQMLSEDNDVKNARAAVQAALEANNNNAYAPDVQAASEALKKAQLKARINVYKKLYPNIDVIDYAKEGTKLVNKRSERLLYKTAKDIIDHFRRMSKMTDDSRIRSKDKPLKLSQHPMKKMQQGGIAPFTKYRPAPVGLESAGTAVGGSSASAGSSKSSGGKDETLEFIKKLFSDIKGLPIDVQSVYDSVQGVLNRAQAFGEELSTSQLATMYLNSMRQLNNIAHSQKVYDDARQLAIKNDAMGEYAVTADGRYMVQNMENPDEPIKAVSFDDYVKNSKKYNLLTNGALLSMRPYSANMALQSGNNLMNMAVSNAIGMSKIGDEIKKLAGTLGSSEREIEGLTKAESGKVKAGLQLLANDAPDGVYKINQYEKNQRGQIEAALNYIQRMLPTNYKAVLQMHAAQNGISIPQMIAYSLGAGSSDSVKTHITPLSGSASANADKSGSGNLTPAAAFSLGLGEKDTILVQNKTNDALKLNTVSMPMLDSSGHGMETYTLQQAVGGQFTGQLNSESATMGGAKIALNGSNNVLINGKIHQAELPIDQEAYRTIGVIKPDLDFLANIENADQEIRNAGITDRSNLSATQIKTINEIYAKHNLPIIYTYDGSGKPQLTSEYRRFAMFTATATEDAFEDGVNFNNGVREASDAERDRFEVMMRQVTKDSKYKLDDPTEAFGIKLWGGTDLYTGILYVPMTNSHIAALAGTGYQADASVYNNIEAQDQLADNIKASGYVSPGHNFSNK